MGSSSITFAGIKTKLTSTGGIRRPALIKMLRSGLVTMKATHHCPHAVDGDDNSCDPIWIAQDIEDSSGHSARASGWYGTIGDSIVSGQILRIGCHSHRSYSLIEDPEAAAAAAPQFAHRRAWDKRSRANNADGRARLFESRTKDNPDSWANAAKMQREEATKLEAIAVAAEAEANALGLPETRADYYSGPTPGPAPRNDDTAAQVAEVSRVIDCLVPIDGEAFAQAVAADDEETARLEFFLGL